MFNTNETQASNSEVIVILWGYTNLEFTNDWALLGTHEFTNNYDFEHSKKHCAAKKIVTVQNKRNERTVKACRA